MTFYSIIFGILFVSVCREILQAFFERKWLTLSLASTVALLIFNDVIYTSHGIDQMGRFYTIQMKLVDLLLFILLAMSIVLLDPQNNLLGAKVDLDYLHGRQEALLWGLLSLYWILGLVWDWLGDRYKGLQWPMPILMSLPFLGMLFLTFKKLPGQFIRGARWVVLIVLFLYIFVFKLVFYEKRIDELERKNNAWPADAATTQRR
jgi:hypothetical protein